MKHFNAILIAIVLLTIGTSIKAQIRNFTFFGSYNRSFGLLTGEVDSDLQYPVYDEVEKLTTGVVNQFEGGSYYKSFGLGLIYNAYAADATTSYENADVNSDSYPENGILNDNLKLRFTGLEIQYKRPLFSSRFDICWKIALGMQFYYLENNTQIMGTYPYSYSRKVSGNIFTTLLGMETDYRIWKMISVGAEASLIPGNFKELKIEDSEYTTTDNVSRFNAGLKIAVTL
jgi:hypothetical protein